MTYSALFDYFTKVADKSPIPIILHNVPAETFIDLPIELILDLADHPNIAGLKECSHNVNIFLINFFKAIMLIFQILI
jgi:4-hydroxy-2-oxoglutarate aldolase